MASTPKKTFWVECPKQGITEASIFPGTITGMNENTGCKDFVLTFSNDYLMNYEVHTHIVLYQYIHHWRLHRKMGRKKSSLMNTVSFSVDI